MERLAFAPCRVARSRELPQVAPSETRPLASRPDCRNSILALPGCFTDLQGTVYQLQCTAKVQLFKLLYICTLDFKSILKLVDFLSSGREMSCQCESRRPGPGRWRARANFRLRLGRRLLLRDSPSSQLPTETAEIQFRHCKVY